MKKSLITVFCLFHNQTIGINKNLSFVKILSLLGFFLIFFPLFLHAQEKLSISTFEGQGPFVRIGETVMRKVYRQANIKLELHPRPGKRSIVEANHGKFDGELVRAPAIEKEYKNLIRIPVSIVVSELAAFTSGIDFVPNGWQSLKPYSIALTLGQVNAEVNTRNMKREIVPSFESAFLMLYTQRVDVVVTGHLRGHMTIKNLGLGESIKELSPPLEEVKLYHYLHSSKKNLISQITEILQKMEKDGTLQKIQNKIEMQIINGAKTPNQRSEYESSVNN